MTDLHLTRRGEGPNPIDIGAGKRLKAIRMLNGLSQYGLADKVGVTFQQLQKYERGTNRISASRLYQFSIVLNVPVSEFFPGGMELLDKEKIETLKEYRNALKDISRRTGKIIDALSSQESEGAGQ